MTPRGIEDAIWPTSSRPLSAPLRKKRISPEDNRPPDTRQCSPSKQSHVRKLRQFVGHAPVGKLENESKDGVSKTQGRYEKLEREHAIRSLYTPWARFTPGHSRALPLTPRKCTPPKRAPHVYLKYGELGLDRPRYFDFEKRRPAFTTTDYSHQNQGKHAAQKYDTFMTPASLDDPRLRSRRRGSCPPPLQTVLFKSCPPPLQMVLLPEGVVEYDKEPEVVAVEAHDIQKQMRLENELEKHSLSLDGMMHQAKTSITSISLREESTKKSMTPDLRHAGVQANPASVQVSPDLDESVQVSRRPDLDDTGVQKSRRLDLNDTIEELFRFPRAQVSPDLDEQSEDKGVQVSRRPDLDKSVKVSAAEVRAELQKDREENVSDGILILKKLKSQINMLVATIQNCIKNLRRGLVPASRAFSCDKCYFLRSGAAILSPPGSNLCCKTAVDARLPEGNISVTPSIEVEDTTLQDPAMVLLPLREEISDPSRVGIWAKDGSGVWQRMTDAQGLKVDLEAGYIYFQTLHFCQVVAGIPSSCATGRQLHREADFDETMKEAFDLIKVYGDDHIEVIGSAGDDIFGFWCDVDADVWCPGDPTEETTWTGLADQLKTVAQGIQGHERGMLKSVRAGINKEFHTMVEGELASLIEEGRMWEQFQLLEDEHTSTQLSKNVKSAKGDSERAKVLARNLRQSMWNGKEVHDQIRHLPPASRKGGLEKSGQERTAALKDDLKASYDSKHKIKCDMYWLRGHKGRSTYIDFTFVVKLLHDKDRASLRKDEDNLCDQRQLSEQITDLLAAGKAMKAAKRFRTMFRNNRGKDRQPGVKQRCADALDKLEKHLFKGSMAAAMAQANSHCMSLVEVSQLDDSSSLKHFYDNLPAALNTLVRNLESNSAKIGDELRDLFVHSEHGEGADKTAIENLKQRIQTKKQHIQKDTSSSRSCLGHVEELGPLTAHMSNELTALILRKHKISLGTLAKDLLQAEEDHQASAASVHVDKSSKASDANDALVISLHTRTSPVHEFQQWRGVVEGNGLAELESYAKNSASSMKEVLAQWEGSLDGLGLDKRERERMGKGIEFMKFQLWLDELKLTEKQDAARDWWNTNGPSSLKEVCEEDNLKGLEEALKLRPLEIRRMEKSAKELERRSDC